MAVRAGCGPFATLMNRRSFISASALTLPAVAVAADTVPATDAIVRPKSSRPILLSCKLDYLII